MLHAKFNGHRSTGSGEVLKIFNIYGHGGHTVLFLNATYEIWLQQVYGLLRKCLNL